jgi:hypothetical protein
VSEAAVDTPPPSGEDQHSFEAALAAALATTQGEPQGQPQTTEAPATEAVGTTEPAQAEQAAQAQAATAPQVPAGDQPPAPSARELERVAALDAREAKVREAEARAKDVERREAALAARETAKWDAFVADPVGHIMSMRPELSSTEAAQIAEKVYFHALGDKAPPEHRTKQEVAKVKTEVSSEVEKLRAEIQELRESRTRAEHEAQLAAYRADLRAGASAAKDAPIVANLIQRNPARAEEMLFEVARRAAIESRDAGAAEPVVLTADAAVAKLEAILKAQRDELYGPPAAAVTQPNVPQNTPSPTITNRDASIQPNRVAPDPNDDKALRKAALEAAGLGHLPVWD